LVSFKESIWALLTPVTILGGIYSGIFTPTEAQRSVACTQLLLACSSIRSSHSRLL
jgi:TRAP-type C4-dicarboxylate transport system permease large subunit